MEHIWSMIDDTKPPAVPSAAKAPPPKAPAAVPQPATKPVVTEIGGPSGPEPTRYGDWERGGRCSDF